MEQLAEVMMYLVSELRMVRLRKEMKFAALPRLREFVEVRNDSGGDFGFEVIQVTHREDQPPELWIFVTSLSRKDGRTRVAHWSDDDLDEYIEGYLDRGWKLESDVPNRTMPGDHVFY